MKRYSFLFILLWAFIEFGNAQTIRAIVFADSNDKNIGAGTNVDVRKFEQLVTEIATGLEVDDYAIDVYSGSQCSPANLKRVISSFSCTKNDIVIFAYFGHGARSVDDKSQFPQMCLASSNQADFIPLKKVHDDLVKKNPRFCFVLGDCCNNYATGVMPKIAMVCAESNTVMSKTTREGLKKLFLENYGSVIAAGCKPGQYSWCNSIEGSFFTVGLINGFDFYLGEKRESYSWKEFMSGICTMVEDYSRRIPDVGGRGYVQTPIYADFTRTTPPAPIPNDSVPSTPVVNDSVPSTPVVNDFVKLLIDAADEKKTGKERENAAKSALKLFADPNVTVDIVGRSHQTIVDFKTAADYVEHVEVAFRLRNFAIVEKKVDSNGKITYLKVNEIYIED